MIVSDTHNVKLLFCFIRYMKLPLICWICWAGCLQTNISLTPCPAGEVVDTCITFLARYVQHGSYDKWSTLCSHFGAPPGGPWSTVRWSDVPASGSWRRAASQCDSNNLIIRRWTIILFLCYCLTMGHILLGFT